MHPAIETLGLARRFPGGHGVHGLDLKVPAGAIYGFLGPNGAGKTTTIRLLLGLLRPDADEVHLLGEPLTPRHRGALARVGALVNAARLYDRHAQGALALADAHPGVPVILLRSLNGSVVNETPKSFDPALDPYNPANGYNPSGASAYTADFQARYYAAQSMRLKALISPRWRLR